MAKTPLRGYTYPGVNDAPDGPYAFQKLAEDIAADVDGVDKKITSYPHLELDRSDAINAANSTWGPGTAAQLAAAVTAAPYSRTPEKFDYPATGVVRVIDAGYYSGSWAIVEPKSSTDVDTNFTGFSAISTNNGTNIIADCQVSNARSMTAHFTPRYFPSGATLSFAFQSTAALKFRHRITLTRHP